jgi:hypothetical protein
LLRPIVQENVDEENFFMESPNNPLHVQVELRSANVDQILLWILQL